MKSKEEVENLLNSHCKTIENCIGVKFRNGQGTQASKQTLRWVLSDMIQIGESDQNNKIHLPTINKVIIRL